MLYLLTNPRTRQCGIYLLPKKYIAFEMGLSLDVVLSLLKKFEKEYRNIIYDDKTQEVAVLNAMKHNIITGGTPVSDLIRKELSMIQSSRLIQAVFDNMKDHWEASARKIDKDVLALFDDEISRRHVECKLNENENENENEKSYGDTACVSSHESSDVSSSTADDDVFITMPLNDGSMYGVPETDLSRYVELYPAVDVEQELRNMVGWLESNRAKRKTRNGIRRFITNWLSRAQNTSRTVSDRPISNRRYVGDNRHNFTDDRTIGADYDTRMPRIIADVPDDDSRQLTASDK